MKYKKTRSHMMKSINTCKKLMKLLEYQIKRLTPSLSFNKFKEKLNNKSRSTTKIQIARGKPIQTQKRIPKRPNRKKNTLKSTKRS